MAPQSSSTARLASDKAVLLFYKEYERDRIFRGDRHLRRALRPVYNLIRSDQVVSGFYVWFQLLVGVLEQTGHKVHVNNFRLARANPEYPVGIAGYPVVLDRWSLPNPAILGPGLFDHPAQRPDLMTDPRFKRYILTCQWMYDMFSPVYGRDKCINWYAGIDTATWSPASAADDGEAVDFLIYDKIRWNRDTLVPGLLEPILAALDRLGLKHTTVRYGQYTHELYRRALRQSKAMLFLCEHETQGMAYQEALAANVPILAWDNGYWLDPTRPQYAPEPVAASSVPYFSAACGERFKDLDEFPASLTRFLERLGSYQPRRYVQQALSREGSARIYSQHYFELLAADASV